MDKPTRPFAGGARAIEPLDFIPLPDDLRLARTVRANVLLIDRDSIIQSLLKVLLQDLREPVASWSPGETLVLPEVAWTRTMLLHDVGALPHVDQWRLLSWLDRAAGRTQVVSTTRTPLLPRVQTGAFLDTLYYRLNTVCVDVTNLTDSSTGIGCC